MYNAFNYTSPYITTAYQPNPYAATAAKQEVIKVSGVEGARAYQMAPNSSTLLLDCVNPIVYLKTTDGAGFPTITPYKIEPAEEPQTINTSDLEKRIERLEALVNESYTANVKQLKQYTSSNRADKTNANGQKSE